MFRKITILRLMENDELLNFDLNWPAKVQKPLNLGGNIELLRYAGLLEGSVARRLVDQGRDVGYPSVWVPVHTDINQRVSWVSDVSEAQYKALTDLIQSVFPEVSTSLTQQYWVSKDVVKDDLSDDYQIPSGSPMATKLQELEMMLYAHPLNQSRLRYQKKPITGFMLGSVGSRSWRRPKRMISDAPWVQLLSDTQPLINWLNNPYPNCNLIMGREAGDQELFQVKETVMHLMEIRRCDWVEVIQPKHQAIYSGNRFYNAYTHCKDYLFSKEAM